jgi:hypothetical protein
VIASIVDVATQLVVYSSAAMASWSIVAACAPPRQVASAQIAAITA